MIRAFGRASGLAEPVERVAIHVSAEESVGVIGQILTVKNSINDYVFFEGIASDKIVVKIPLGITYVVSITDLDGYAPVAPIIYTATEKTRTVYINYKKTPPAVGDFVYADGSWSGLYKTDKTCVGICYYVNGEDRRVMALTRPITGSGSNPIGDSAAVWGTTIPAGILETSSQDIAITDMCGRENTNLILTLKQTNNPLYSSLDDYPAANYCNNFSFGNKGRGSWWLPACGELYLIQQNFEIINQNIGIAGGTQPVLREYFWSSTRYNSLARAVPLKSLIWIVRLDYMDITTANLTDMRTILPVTNF